LVEPVGGSYGESLDDTGLSCVAQAAHCCMVAGSAGK
jgi:hypothetical protein